MQKQKYITNKDLLAEIARSKNSYCRYDAPEYAIYDAIVQDLSDLTPAFITALRQSKAEKLSKSAPTTAAQIDPASLVVRVMTGDHIPPDPSGKLVPRAPRDPDSDDEAVLDEDRIQGVRTCFKPFKHYVLRDGLPIEVGRSHWKGSIEEGGFSNIHGQISRGLAEMLILLVDRYSRRFNWRSYCVDPATEALTQRGWLTQDRITTDDTILSFDGTRLTWSGIKSIYRADYDGLMFHLTVSGMDALVTPGHKFVTQDGLKPVELLLVKDRVIMTGEPVAAPAEPSYEDAFVELVGWMVTEGSIYNETGRHYPRISIHQNEGPKADRIRACLDQLGSRYSERYRQNKNAIGVIFDLTKSIACQLVEVIEVEEKVLTMPFILSLTQPQRDLLIETMIAGDGYHCHHTGYVQRSKRHMDAFVALCTLAGKRTSVTERDMVSFGKPTHIQECNIFRMKARHSNVENIDFHGGKRRGSGLTKLDHPNEPTVPYRGPIWCPETEFGCFMARRNGKVYLTGNTYLDEMRSHALVQLSQIALQFNEAKSDNPFAFYTKVMLNCFRRVLNVERRNQNLRDDLLIMAGVQPSFTRQIDNEMEQRNDEPVASTEAGKPAPKKRGRKPKLRPVE